MKKTLLTMLFVALMIPAAIAGPAASRNVGSVRVELRLNKSAFDIGESIEITLELSNQGPETTSVQFPTGQMYDLVVLSGSQRIWQWSLGRVFTQAFTTLSLRAGESKVFQERWNQRDAQDHQVPLGEYEMVAVFPAQGSRIPSSLEGPRVQFRIGAGSQVSTPNVSSRALTIAGTQVGEVLLNGLPVLRIRVAAGGMSAVERAAVVANRLRQLLDAGLRPNELIVVRAGSEAAIMWRGRLVVTADTSHARFNQTTAYALALQWRQSLVRALSL